MTPAAATLARMLAAAANTATIAAADAAAASLLDAQRAALADDGYPDDAFGREPFLTAAAA